MIKELTIKNFQSHKNTRLEFDEGVNIIIGKSNSGKTSILRAINWITNNRPAGDSFRSSWGGDTSAKITLDDSIEISREKGKDNLYKVETDKTTDVFASFGQDVPQDIKDEINFNELNIQCQMDSPFLLSQSSGEVTRLLNKIARLDSIDTSLANVESKKRKIRSQLSYKKEELENKEKEIKKYNFIEEAEKKIQKAGKIENEIVEKAKIIEHSKILIEILDEEIASMSKYSKKIKLSASVEKSLSIIQTISKKKDEISEINTLATHIKHLAEKIKKYNSVVAKEKQIKEMLSLIAEIDKKRSYETKLLDFINEINAFRKEVEEIRANIFELENEFADKMPDVCPLCGQER